MWSGGTKTSRLHTQLSPSTREEWQNGSTSVRAGTFYTVWITAAAHAALISALVTYNWNSLIQGQILHFQPKSEISKIKTQREKKIKLSSISKT